MSDKQGEWVRIARLSDIPKRGARLVKTLVGPIAVFRTFDDKVFALDNKCPHKDGPLSEGLVYGYNVSCPLHNLQIDLRTGEAKGSGKGRVKTYQVKLKDEQIFLDILPFEKIKG